MEAVMTFLGFVGICAIVFWIGPYCDKVNQQKIVDKVKKQLKEEKN
jgi:hypothetical protein